MSDLSKLLAKLFSDHDRIRLLLLNGKTGIDPATVDFQGIVGLVWERVLEEAWKRGQVQSLVEAASAEYAQRGDDLAAGMKRFLAARGPSPQIEFPERRKRMDASGSSCCPIDESAAEPTTQPPPDLLNTSTSVHLGAGSGILQYTQRSLPPVNFPASIRPVDRLYGRQKELADLKDWLVFLSSPRYSKKVLVIEAESGTGKSSLAWEVFQNIAPERWRGMFWWRMYENEPIEPFLDAAFRYVCPRQSSFLVSTVSEARIDALVQTLKLEPFLFVLDGFERALDRRKERAFDQKTANIGAFVFLDRFLEATDVLSRILITTQPRPDLRRKYNLAASFLPLGPLTQEGALDLYNSIVTQPLSNAGKDQLIQLLGRLGKQPVLVIAIAGAVNSNAVSQGSFDMWQTQHPGCVELGLGVSTWIGKYIIADLSRNARVTLFALAAFNNLCSKEVLQAISGIEAGSQSKPLDPQQLDDAIEELKRGQLITEEGHDDGSSCISMHQIISEAGWNQWGRETSIQHARLMYATLVAADRCDDAYDLLMGRLNPDDFDAKYAEDRFGLMKMLFNVDQGELPMPGPPDKLKDQNKLAVALACIAGAYLWRGTPERSLPFLRRQIEVRRKINYITHEQKARAVFAYACYLCGYLRDASLECSRLLESTEEPRKWADVLPEALNSWLSTICNPNIVSPLDPAASADARLVAEKNFRRHFGEWTEKGRNSIFTRELELREALDLCRQRIADGLRTEARLILDELHSNNRLAPYPLLQADGLLLLVLLEREAGRSDQAIAAATRAFSLAYCDGPEFSYKVAVEAARMHLEELGAHIPEVTTEARPVRYKNTWKSREETDYRVRFSHNDIGDVWIEIDGNPHVDFYYGGTRLVPPNMADAEILGLLNDLVQSESGLKNRLIDRVLANGALNHLADRLPKGFLTSRVGGARCIVRPKAGVATRILAHQLQPGFDTLMEDFFEPIAGHLERQRGKIKLTPDFGRFAHFADIMARFTKHVMGIRCEDGGCGGKSSYTVTGINVALEALGLPGHCNRDNVTLIGAAGALGSGILSYLLEHCANRLAVCDLAYETNTSIPPAGTRHLNSEEGRFSEACLARGGLIIATTTGRELERSRYGVIAPDTILLLAHNLALPPEPAAIVLVKEIESLGCTIWPGQILTLGGALTSRLEWYWRQDRTGQPFDKELAHDLVRTVVRYMIQEINLHAKNNRESIYNGLLGWAKQEG